MKICIIAGGGTGGHIYPGLAFAEALLKNSDWKVHFVGTKAGLESQILPKHISLHFLPISGWQGVGFLKKIKVGLYLPLAFLKSIYLLWTLRPSYILGLGGYASGPLVLVGAWMGFPTVIWEMNAYPGLTNRILSRFVKECWVVFENSKAYLKSQNIRKVSLPVREEIKNISLKKIKKPSVENILIFGGSRGAKSINKCVLEWLKTSTFDLSQFNIRWQTGALQYKSLQHALKQCSNMQTNVQIYEYLHHIEQDYAWADLVICRAGASTLAELATIGMACLLIPFAHSANDHQRKNAEVFFQKQAVLMILEKDLTPKCLESEILKLVHQPQLKQTLEHNMFSLKMDHAYRHVFWQ